MSINYKHLKTFIIGMLIGGQLLLIADKLFHFINFSWWLVWLPGLLCLAALLYIVIVAVWFTD